MRQLLLGFCFTLSGVCIPAFPDVAAMSATKLGSAKLPASAATLALRSPDRIPPSAPVESDAGKAGPAESVHGKTDQGQNDTSKIETGETNSSESSRLSPTSSSKDSSQPSAKSTAAPATVPSHEEFCTLLMSSAKENTLPIGFFANLIWQESRFVRTAVSSAGALGVAQFMPAVAESVGLRNPFDPREALPASARLLKVLHSQFGNLGLAAAAYNAGPKRVLDWLAKRSGLPRETRHYVLTVTGRPAEHWATGSPPIAFQVPAAVPCFRVASFSAAVKPADATPPRESFAALKSSEKTIQKKTSENKNTSEKKIAKTSGFAKKLSARVKTAVRQVRTKVAGAKRPGYTKEAALKTSSKTVQR